MAEGDGASSNRSNEGRKFVDMAIMRFDRPVSLEHNERNEFNRQIKWYFFSLAMNVVLK
jgi:hypothetical protein